MMGSNPPENSTISCASEARPGCTLDDDVHQQQVVDGPALKMKVSHGSNLVDVSVPSSSTFGDLKRFIARETGLEPQMQKLLFRGKEKEDCDLLQMAGVKDDTQVVLLMEDARDEEMKSREMNETSEILRGVAAVADVRAEVDNLSEQVSALQAVVYGGEKVEERDIVYLTEMLMRQLLKLDSIEAEGEGKIQRKMEVRRVQSFVEIMDTLKARNSTPFSDSSNAVSSTTQWETFNSAVANPSAPIPMPCSTSTKVTQQREQFD
ncbi:hypothetical protein ACH5RR_005189 [Cinchona calisaya]|uniref:BAG family molecular chaperone regulator 4 n=1 Tax=Cinchona calisaya TaxID=153742 RepID=A0ABD3AKI7_9GENT